MRNHSRLKQHIQLSYSCGIDPAVFDVNVDVLTYNPNMADSFYNPNKAPNYLWLLVPLYSFLILETGGHGPAETPFSFTGANVTITNNEELRIVMVGKTGTGKSATGNTILGRECFESKFSAVSMTVETMKGNGTVDGQKVAVIDTPGFFDTRHEPEKTEKDIAKCIMYAAPGPHVFLVIIRLGRYTAEEMNTVQRIQQIFGQAADRYSMVLFTHGDLLEGTTIKDFLDESPELQELVARCNGQYHVFNNKNQDCFQVPELLQKVRGMVQKNGGSHYTNEMFQEAERAMEEERQRILKEKEEQIRKEREELERKVQAPYEEQMKKMTEQFQAERERERKEREEERRREREEIDKERERERQEREAERWRERQEREEEKRRMKEKYDNDLEAKRRELESRRRTRSRGEAASSNPFLLLLVSVIGGLFG